MADYWKSQPKKLCKYCKCWIADNKASIDFHERGKRHKENVQKRLEEVRQKSVDDAKKKEELNESLIAMEKAALEALKRDVAADPSMAARYGVRLKQKTVEPEKQEKEESSSETAKDTGSEQSESTPVEEKAGEWYEALSEQGYIYYWNTVSGESVWEKPAKFVSIAEQQLQSAPAEVSTGKDEAAASSESDKSSSEDETEEEKTQEKMGNAESAEAEPVSNIPLPQVTEMALDVTSIPLPGSIPLPESPTPEEKEEEEETEPEPVPRKTQKPGAYGAWETIQEEVQEEVDLQLPESAIKDNQPAVPDPGIMKEARIKFREKKVDTLGQEFIAFKKRKLAKGARNIRKVDND